MNDQGCCYQLSSDQITVSATALGKMLERLNREVDLLVEHILIKITLDLRCLNEHCS